MQHEVWWIFFHTHKSHPVLENWKKSIRRAAYTAILGENSCLLPRDTTVLLWSRPSPGLQHDFLDEKSADADRLSILSNKSQRRPLWIIDKPTPLKHKIDHQSHLLNLLFLEIWKSCLETCQCILLLNVSISNIMKQKLFCIKIGCPALRVLGCELAEVVLGNAQWPITSRSKVTCALFLAWALGCEGGLESLEYRGPCRANWAQVGVVSVICSRVFGEHVFATIAKLSVNVGR